MIRLLRVAENAKNFIHETHETFISSFKIFMESGFVVICEIRGQHSLRSWRFCVRNYLD